jgi:uncharacterized protein (DUF1778 family)
MSLAAEAPKDARLDLRMPAEAREMIEQAARLSGQNLTDYVLNRVLPAARAEILQTRAIQLSHDAWQEFIDIMDRTDNERLAALRQHTPTWAVERS